MFDDGAEGGYKIRKVVIIMNVNAGSADVMIEFADEFRLIMMKAIVMMMMTAIKTVVMIMMTMSLDHMRGPFVAEGRAISCFPVAVNFRIKN